MDSIFLQRMRENRRWFLLMSLIYGVLFTFCLYRNLSGITFPVITAVSLWFSVLFLRKAGITFQKGTLRYFAGILLLGISTVLTDSGFFHFFNRVGILLLFMMGMAHQLYKDSEWGFTEYVKKFFTMLWTWIISVGELFRRSRKNSDVKITADGEVHTGAAAEENTSDRKMKWKNAGPVLLGILAALLMLIIVLPLLMMSDEIFLQVFNRLFRFLNPFHFMRNIDFGNMIGIVFTFLFGMVSLYAFFAGLFKMNLTRYLRVKSGSSSYITGITFTGIMAAVYVFYSGIQILFLFLRLDSGLPEGVTYSQYAHQGFWQLLFVSLINFVTVLVCAKIFEDNRVLKILLTVISVCTCIMILSAAYRMVLYVNEYDLSFLRVLVLWFLAVLMVIFFGVIYSIFKKDFMLFRYITAVVSVCYILFSFSHPDALIARYNIQNVKETEETDLYYLMYGLSEDAAGEIACIDVRDIKDSGMAIDVENYFKEICGENQRMSLREWNYSRAAAGKAAEEWLSDGE